MFWWGTVPAATCGSQRYAARESRRPGSRYRYCLVSPTTFLGDERRNGTYARTARPLISRAVTRAEPFGLRSAATGDMELGILTSAKSRQLGTPSQSATPGGAWACVANGTQREVTCLAARPEPA